MGGATFLPQFSQGRLLAVNKARPYAVWRGKRTGLKTDHYRNSEKGLLFMGPSGVGKTHLAVAALKELIHRGHAGLFCDYRELLKEIQASYNPASESTEMKILEPIRTMEILVLDDLGASKPSDWVRDIVGIVLNARYNENRTTIITTNYLDNPATEGEVARLPNGKLIAPTREDALEQRIGSRIRSKLYEMSRTVELSAPDIRGAKTHAVPASRLVL